MMKKEEEKSSALSLMYAFFLMLVIIGGAVFFFCYVQPISKAAAAESQQKCLELPTGFAMEDLNAALQLGWESRITKGEIPKCNEAYRPAMQPAMETARKCWNLNTCSKVVTDSAREAMGCPPLKKTKKKPKKNVTGRDIF